MRFQLNIACDNAAFDDALGEHTATLLHSVAGRVDAGATSGEIRDGNGNRVGRWEFIEDPAFDDGPTAA